MRNYADGENHSGPGGLVYEGHPFLDQPLMAALKQNIPQKEH